MGADPGELTDGAGVEQPWRLRLCAESGVVLGAATLLGGAYALTCAHVLRAGQVLIDAHGGEPVPAHLVEDLLVPPEEDGTGDLALLELARPLPAAWGARLRAGSPAPGRPVAAYGFPAGAPHGMWARAELSRSAGPGSEWVQLDARSAGNRVRRGFSGGGVLDESSGDVVGLVVSEYSAEGSVVAWMQPVRTITGYLPVVTEWVLPGPLPPIRLPELDGWLPQRGPGDILVVITGESDSARSQALRELTDRLGSALVVLEVAGRTPAEVARQLAERAGQPVRPDLTLVLVGVDSSAEPEELVTRVLNPLAEQGTAVIAGYRTPDAPSLAAIRSPGTVSGVARRSGTPDTLTPRIAALAALEAEVRRLWGGAAGARFAGEAEPPQRADGLRPWLAAVRALPEPERGPKLAECARRVDRGLRKATDARNRLLVLRERLRELRGLIQSYQRMAAAHGLAEDTALDARYREALARTLVRPCELGAAEAAVQEYLRAVVRRVRGG